MRTGLFLKSCRDIKNAGGKRRGCTGAKVRDRFGGCDLKCATETSMDDSVQDFFVLYPARRTNHYLYTNAHYNLFLCSAIL